MSAAEALTNFQLSFIFYTERAYRLVQLKARAGTIGWDDVLDAVINTTWKSAPEKGLKGAVQLQTQQMVITWMLGLSQSEQSTYAVKAICFERLQSLKKYAEQLSKTATDKSHYLYAVERISKPKEIALPVHKEIPPGAPIGCDFE